MAELIEVLVWVVVAFAAYCLLLNRLAVFVHPLRVSLARRGERLLQSPHLPKWAARQLQLELDTMFNGWWAIGAAALLPIAIIGFALGLLKPNPEIEHAETRREYNGLAWLFCLSFVAANPLVGMVFLLELVVFGFVVALFGGTVISLRAATAFAFGCEAEWLRMATLSRQRIG